MLVAFEGLRQVLFLYSSSLWLCLVTDICCVFFQVLLKLFSYCVKVKVNRQQLVKLEMNTLNVMLGTLNLVRFFQRCDWYLLSVIVDFCGLSLFLSLLQALVAEQESKDSGGAAVAEQVLSIMEIILDESNAEPLSEDKVRPQSCDSNISIFQNLPYSPDEDKDV